MEYQAGLGLSPRVRGNPVRGHYGSVLFRSIPACAGEPLVFTDANVFKEVYPRVCGGTYIPCRRICTH